MTVENDVHPVEQYPFTGSGTTYIFAYKVHGLSNIIVEYTDQDAITTVLTYGVDYSTTLINGGEDGVSVLIIYDPREPYRFLTIQRSTPIGQETNWFNNNAFNAELLEYNLDHAIMILQEYEARIVAGRRQSVWRGLWAPYTAYYTDNIIEGPAPSYSYYIATMDHQSDVDFQVDVDAGRLELFLDVSRVYTAMDAAEVSAVNAAASETNAAVSATNAATSATDAQLSATNAALAEINATNCSDQAEAYSVEAYNWARYPTNNPVPEGDGSEYSARHWAFQASAVTGEVVPRTTFSGSAIMPTGTTAERDASPIVGYLRYNTSFDQLEAYNGVTWVAVVIDEIGDYVARQTSNAGALKTPYGDTSLRPASPEVGYFRFNTQFEQLEYWDGFDWIAVSKYPPPVNLIMNPNMKVNQRNFSGNWGSYGWGEFGWDRWYRYDVDDMAQMVEGTVLEPGASYALYGDNIIPIVLTAPASGPMLIQVPFAARNISLVKGDQIYAYIEPDYATELQKCLRFFCEGRVDGNLCMPENNALAYSGFIAFPTPMRDSTPFMQSTISYAPGVNWSISNYYASQFGFSPAIAGSGMQANNTSTLGMTWSAEAELRHTDP